MTIELAELPIIDLSACVNDNEFDQLQCELVAKCFHEYGVIVVKDPRVDEKHNDEFLNMMESYFEQSDFQTDARPELSYQIGVTPELTERPRNHCTRIHATFGHRLEDAPLTLCPPELDKKSRFFWKVGPRPLKTAFEELNAKPVIPNDFPQWTNTMNMWGNKMLETLQVVAQMIGTGLKLDNPLILKEYMQYGPHLLAPTGSSFHKYGQVNTVLAGYHYDLNLLTIHGKSRFPGLFVWLRDGRKVRVKIPNGCLLIQAGRQLEYLTGGQILAGFHEVVVTADTLKVIETRRGKSESLWRVSSTLFGHTAADQILAPLLTTNSTSGLEHKYPAILAGDQVRQELKAIQLGK